MYIFSATWMRCRKGLPSRSSPPPPSLMPNSASISSRLLLTSQYTPLEGTSPRSSSAVSARMRSRLGQPRLPEMPGHAMRSERGIAGRMRGVRFDQLLVDGVKPLLLRAERLGLRRDGNRADDQGADGSPVHVN